MKTSIVNYTKSQFINIKGMIDPHTGKYSTMVEPNVQATFVDGYTFGFGEGKKTVYAKAVIRRSLDGSLAAFFYYDKAKAFDSFVCGHSLMDLLFKVYDIAFLG